MDWQRAPVSPSRTTGTFRRKSVLISIVFIFSAFFTIFILFPALQFIVLQPHIDRGEPEGTAIKELAKDPYIVIAAGTVNTENTMFGPLTDRWRILKFRINYDWKLGDRDAGTVAAALDDGHNGSWSV